MKKGKNNPGLFGEIMLPYFIVLPHVRLIAGLGVLIYQKATGKTGRNLLN